MKLIIDNLLVFVVFVVYITLKNLIHLSINTNKYKRMLTFYWFIENPTLKNEKSYIRE